LIKRSYLLEGHTACQLLKEFSSTSWNEKRFWKPLNNIGNQYS